MQQVEEKCIKCKKYVEDEENIYRCDSCKQPIHEECAELSSSEIRCMPLKKRKLRLLCDVCKQFMENLPVFYKLVESIQLELSELKKLYLENVQKSTRAEANDTDGKDVAENQSNKVTYSQKVKSKKEVLIVKPKEKKNHSEVEKDLGNKVDPLELNVEVQIGKSVRDGGYILECNKGDVEQVKKKIEKDMGEQYTVSEPRKSNPLVKIVSVPANIPRDKDMLKDRIVKQNGLENGKPNFVFEILHLSVGNNRRYNIIVEVDVGTFNELLAKGEVYIGLYSCRVFEFVRLRKCYKCCGYNHIAQECSEKQACPRCGEEHQQKDCKAKEVQCVNCIRANKKYNLQLDSKHTTWDRACKCLVKTEELKKGKMHYSQ